MVLTGVGIPVPGCVANGYNFWDRLRLVDNYWLMPALSPTFGRAVFRSADLAHVTF